MHAHKIASYSNEITSLQALDNQIITILLFYRPLKGQYIIILFNFLSIMLILSIFYGNSYLRFIISFNSIKEVNHDSNLLVITTDRKITSLDGSASYLQNF